MERNLLFFCVSRNGSYTILDRVETSEYVQVWGAFKWASASDFNTFLFKQVGKGHLSHLSPTVNLLSLVCN